VVSENIKVACEKSFYFQEVDRVRVKGKILPSGLYTPHRLEDMPAKHAEIELYEQALNEYKLQRFEAAKAIFERLREHSDKRLYAVYQERCVILAANPPGPDWDHVFTHEKK